MDRYHQFPRKTPSALHRQPIVRHAEGIQIDGTAAQAYEQWLHAATGQTEHHQTYPWGELVLANYRQEGYLFQINYSE